MATRRRDKCGRRRARSMCTAACRDKFFPVASVFLSPVLPAFLEEYLKIIFLWLAACTCRYVPVFIDTCIGLLSFHGLIGELCKVVSFV